MAYYHDCLITDARLLLRGDLSLAREIMENVYPWRRAPGPARRGRYSSLVWC